ncbi:MAG: FAD-dependent oxidoreductase [Acidimicrobiales bacterium]
MTVIAETGGETLRFEGDYLVGADGGRSSVRKLLGVEFEGYTWPERFLVLTTRFDFQAEWNCSLRNYMADPQEWVNLFKVAGNDGSGKWRAVFPTQVEEDDEQALSDEAARRRLGRLAKENPAGQLLHRKLYNVHQRVAASFRQGRVFLAGDAAHVNNPIGGLGLNCGIHDAMELVDTLHAAGSADDPLLDRYEARRRAINIEFVQGQTVANKQRLEEKDPAQRRRRFDELAALAADPLRHKAFLRRSSLLESVERAQAIGV